MAANGDRKPRSMPRGKSVSIIVALILSQPTRVLPPIFSDRASISATTSSIDQRRLSIRAAIAGETRSVLWMRTKLYQSAYSATMYSRFCSFLLKPFVGRVNRRIAETLRIVMSLIIGAIPIAVVGLILRKATQLRHAASWPSTRARIIKSEPRPVHRCRNGVTQVVSVPDIQYEFSLGDRVIRGRE